MTSGYFWIFLVHFRRSHPNETRFSALMDYLRVFCSWTNTLMLRPPQQQGMECDSLQLCDFWLAACNLKPGKIEWLNHSRGFLKFWCFIGSGRIYNYSGFRSSNDLHFRTHDLRNTWPLRFGGTPGAPRGSWLLLSPTKATEVRNFLVSLAPVIASNNYGAQVRCKSCTQNYDVFVGMVHVPSTDTKSSVTYTVLKYKLLTMLPPHIICCLDYRDIILSLMPKETIVLQQRFWTELKILSIAFVCTSWVQLKNSQARTKGLHTQTTIFSLTTKPDNDFRDR